MPETCIKLPNGITLYPERGMAKMLQGHAESKGLSLRVFVAVHPNASRTYILVDGQDVIFENTVAEAVWSRIDMMAADRDMPR